MYWLMLRPVWRFSKKKIQVFDLVCPHFWTEISHRLLVWSIFVYWFIFLSHDCAHTRTRTHTHTLSFFFYFCFSPLQDHWFSSVLTSPTYMCTLTHSTATRSHTQSHTHTSVHLLWKRWLSQGDWQQLTCGINKKRYFSKKSTPSSSS